MKFGRAVSAGSSSTGNGGQTADKDRGLVQVQHIGTGGDDLIESCRVIAHIGKHCLTPGGAQAGNAAPVFGLDVFQDLGGIIGLGSRDIGVILPPGHQLGGKGDLAHPVCITAP